MNEWKYSLVCDGEVVAEHLVIDYALMFARTLLEKFFAEDDLVIEIRRETRE